MGKFVAPYLKNVVVRHTSPFSGTGNGKVKLPPFGFFLQRSLHHGTRTAPPRCAPERSPARL